MKSRTQFLRLPVAAACAFLATFAHAQSTAGAAPTPSPTPSSQTQTQAAVSNSAETLPTTVVTASRFQEAASTQTQSVSIITAADIRQSGARTVAEALHRVLGLPVTLDLAGTGSGGVDLRGYGATAWSNQVVIVDNLRMNEGDLSAPQLASIPMDSIERIEVVRGASSVLYGEGASAGAIIITTKAGAGVARKTSGSVQVGVGNEGQREVAASGTFASPDGFSMDVAAQQQNADNNRQNFATKNGSANINAQWSNDWLRLGGNLGTKSNQAQLPGPLTAAQYAANPWQASTPTTNDWGNQSTDQHGLFAQAQVGDWELAADSNWRTKAYRSQSSYGAYDFDLNAHNQSLRARHQYKGDSLSNSFIVGYDSDRWQRNILGSFGSSAIAQNTAWYIKDEIHLQSGTQLSAGWRREKAHKTESSSGTDLNQHANAWDVGIAQSLTTNWSVFARAAKGLRMANVDEFSFTPPNYTLLPQTSKDVEAGVRWNATGQSVEARIYRSRVTNEIGYDPNFPNPMSWTGAGANVNFDPTLRSGLEIDAKNQIASNLTLHTNAAWRKAQFRAGAYAGNTVPLVAKRQVSVGLDWQIAAEHSVNTRANWVSSQQVDFNNTCRIPAYSTVDAGYRYTHGAWEFNTQIQNLGNTRYYSMAYSCVGGQPSSIYPEAGRRLNLNLRYQF